MKENDWNDCIETGSSQKRQENKAKATSLIETAKGRNNYLKTNTINEKTINYIFEGYYASTTELIHALLLTKGYVVKNHLCLGYYLRDMLKEEKLYRLFDDSRKKRNALLYYGTQMDFEIAKEAIKTIKKLMKELENIKTL